MDERAALTLIRDVGVSGLGGYDGCVCTSFEVQGVSVYVSCRKGSGSNLPDFHGPVVRVYSGHLDSTEAGLAAIGEVVVAQVAADDGREVDGVRLRLCSYEDDAKQRCGYCHEPRAENWGYYCAKHLRPDQRGWEAA